MPTYCLEFQKNGTCSYGARCKFLHDTQSEDDAWYEKVSKFLANVLRHRANEFRISMQDDGYCRMSEILDLAYLKNLSVREEDLRKIVDNNAKKRFALTVKNNVSYIRANQGHTLPNVKDDKLLEEIEDWRIIENCFHGTYKSILHLIKENGLRCMGRNHMHFACPDISTGVTVSGMREDCEVQLILDVQKCFNDGMKFYRSANGVVLTKGLPGRNSIPFKYFKEEKWLKRHYPNMPASTSSEVPKSLTDKRQTRNKPIPPPPSKSAPSRPAQASLHIESHQDFPPLSSAPGTAKKLRSSQPPAASSSSCQLTIDNHRACSSLTPASGTVVLPSESQQAADDTADQPSRTQNQPNQHFHADSSQNVLRQEQLVEEHRIGHHDREQQERPHSQVEQQNQNFGGPTCLDQPQKQFEQSPENARQGYGNKGGQQRQAGRGAAPHDWNQQGGTTCDHNKSKEGGKGEKSWHSKTPFVDDCSIQCIGRRRPICPNACLVGFTAAMTEIQTPIKVARTGTATLLDGQKVPVEDVGLPPVGSRLRGKILRFKRGSKFGFAALQDPAIEVFCHTLHMGTIPEPYEGKDIFFTLGLNKKGQPQALECEWIRDENTVVNMQHIQ